MSGIDPGPIKPRRWPGMAVAAVASIVLAVAAAGAALTAGRGPSPSAKTVGGLAYLPLYYHASTNTPQPTPTPTASPPPVMPPVSDDWHSILGYYRASAR